MTPEQFAKQLRAFLIRAEKGTALILAYEFEQLKKEAVKFLLSIRPGDVGEIEALLEEIELQVARRTVRFAAAVTNAQRSVITSAAKALNAYLETSIFEADKPAIEKLIGRTQDGTTLSKFFLRLKEPVREAAKDALIDGFAAGESARTIATRLNDVADIGKTRALTIARTETNEAYRAATREFYSGGGIKKYIWMAVLDTRTCVICWRLHGQIFTSNRKVFSHPNCRCVLVPFIKRQKIASGVDLFAKLEAGFQKQILGPKRFELYSGRDARLKDFVGSEESKEFGHRHFIKPLSGI